MIDQYQNIVILSLAISQALLWYRSIMIELKNNSNQQNSDPNFDTTLNYLDYGRNVCEKQDKSFRGEL